MNAVAFMIGLAIVAVVILVLWRTGFARDMVHGIQVARQDPVPPHRRVEAGKGQSVDPVCGMTVAEGEGVEGEYRGTLYRFCSHNCRRRFDAAPDRFVGEESEPVT